MSKLTLQAIRGFKDYLPTETYRWQFIEQKIYQLVTHYGYQEIRLPVVENTELFKRSIGEVTDIVEKEMYTFADRNGDSLTMRPEGTAGCVRACIQHGLLHNQLQRLWYRGPMFRYERPQKGRYRQFYHIGVEAFGMPGPDIDAELILLSARMWKVLGIESQVDLHLNTLGSLVDRQAYRQALVAYLQRYKNDLDADSQRRLDSNPLRILDSKNSQVQAVVADAPKLTDYLSDASQQYFTQLCAYLDELDCRYTLNPLLVRGLDYYSHAVFEWRTQTLGSQDTVCAGGRYDDLFSQLGSEVVPATGFAIGIERLLLLHEQLFEEQALPSKTKGYFIFSDAQARQRGFVLAEQIRTQFPELILICDCSGGSFKSQFKKADKSGATFALILGERELATQTIAIKSLRDRAEQTTIAQTELLTQLQTIIGDKHE